MSIIWSDCQVKKTDMALINFSTLFIQSIIAYLAYSFKNGICRLMKATSLCWLQYSSGQFEANHVS